MLIEFFNMKRILYLFFLIVLPFVAVSQPNASLKNVKISGGLTMTSTTKGLLPPRVTTVERDAISSPAEGLLIYNTDLNELQFFSGGWLTVGGGGVGDMLKSIYDTDSDNLVDDSDSLDGKAPAFYLARANHTGTQTAATISDFDTEVSNNASVTANTAKVTNVTTNLSEGSTTTTTVDVNSSDGTNATLASASASRAGVMTKAKFDEVVVNNAKVTNATHTGDVTGSGALTIANKAVDIVMLADGTDGELITWNAAGVATTVAVGTANQVLTSNGAGSAPEFKDAAGGGDGIYDGDGSLTSTTTVTMGGNKLVFSGNETSLAGLNATSTDTAFLVQDNALTKLFAVSNAGHVIGGTDGGATFGTRDAGVIAKYSFTAGLRNTATSGLSNASSFALGIDNDVTGFFAGALGSTNTVAGRASVAIGENHVLTGNSAIACGSGHTLIGDNAFAGGTLHTLNSDFTFALGNNHVVTGLNAGAFGLSNIVNGKSSIAIGENISITGLNSLAIGQDHIVTDNNVISIGRNCDVSARDGIAIGLDLKAAANNAMVLGVGAGTGANRLINSIATTWMFGANSTVPSFFMDNAGGVGLVSNIGLFNVTAFGASGKGVLGIGSGTAPTTSLADMFQIYSADHGGAGTATIHIRNEQGDIFKYISDGSYVDPTGTSDKGTFATSTVTTEDLAEFVKALYESLKAQGLIKN